MKAQVTETVTIAQAKVALRQTAELYFSKDKNGAYRMDRRRARPVCLMGPAGVGKTEIVRQVAEEQGLAFLSYSITHHTRQSAIGLPRLTEREMGGKLVSATEYTVSEIIAEVYRTMEESGKQEGILFLDEFNCASETMRPIMLQLLQNKTFGPHAIPDGWMLVLAGNPGEYNASASALDAVTADRMRLLWLKPDYAAWREYMVKRHVHPTVLSYLDDHRKHFYVFEKGADGTGLVTGRGWEDLSVLLRMMEEKGFAIDLPFVAQFIQSSQVARQFLTYYQQYSAIVQSGLPDRIMAGNGGAAVEKKVQSMNFTEQWALTSVLLMRLEALSGGAKEANKDSALNAACQAIDNTIDFYMDCLEGQPQVEFLLNGITNSDECAHILAVRDSESYRNAAEKLFFNENQPSVRLLKRLVEQAG